MNSIVTLDQFVKRSELLQFLNDAQNSNLYILYLNYRYHVKNKKVKSSKPDQFYVKYLIKIAKINVVLKYAFSWLKDHDVEWVQYGPILVEQYTALNQLQNKGYIRIEKAPPYIFSWDKIPGNDTGRLRDFLKQNFGIDWMTTAKIEKIDDGTTVRISTENNYISLKLDNEKTKVTLTIDDGRTDKFIAKKIDNNELNIYVADRFNFQFRITEEGVKLIEEKLKGIDVNTDLSANVPFEDEIINLLKLKNEELINKAIEHFGNANSFKVINIGEFKIIQIFDWKEFGDGNWKKCYDSLLWSLQSMDDYGRFRERDVNLYGFSYQDVDQTYYFKPKNGETLRSVFQKSIPPALIENKIEAKNYIINLWYILEAVNIFHAIIGLYPNVDDIARMCLLTYKQEAAKSYKKKDFDKLRRLRESTLRKDIDKLTDAGLLKIVAKDSKKYLYRIRAFEFVYGDERFKLCNHDLIHKKYILRRERELLQSIPVFRNPEENFIEADFHKDLI